MSEPAFASRPPGRLKRFVRAYRAPVIAVTTFALIAAGSWAVNTQRNRDAVPAVATTTPEDLGPSPCVACSLGETCDPATGECRRAEKTPVACHEGSTYDEEQGFCIPNATPEPKVTPAPVRTLPPEATARTTAPPDPEHDGSDEIEGEFGQRPD